MLKFKYPEMISGSMKMKEPVEIVEADGSKKVVEKLYEIKAGTVCDLEVADEEYMLSKYACCLSKKE